MRARLRPVTFMSTYRLKKIKVQREPGKESFMDRLKAIVFGGLVASSLIISAGPALAGDWHRPYRYHRWDDVRDLRSDIHNDRRDLDYYHRDLIRNRRHLDQDLRLGANRHQIARDRRAIQTDLDNIHGIRRDIWQDRWELRDRFDRD